MSNISSFKKALLNLIADPYDKDNCFYGHIIAQCEIHIDNEFDGIAGVGYWNDVFHLYVNPFKFEPFTLIEQKAILIHEAMHIIFNHIPRKGEKNHLRWNIAADASINQYIDNLPDGCIYPKTLKKEKDKFAEYYYEHITEKFCCQLSSLDSHELWNKSQNELNESYSSKICELFIEKAIEKNRGHIPFSVNLALRLLNAPSQISWKSILKRIMGNSKKFYESSYKKINRRFPTRIDMPGKKALYKPTLVAIVDVSGSMSSKEISTGLIEIKKICEITNHKLIVIQVDTEIQDISKLDFKNHNLTRKGCGGTDLYPAVEYIYNNKIPNDMIVFITDGYFHFASWKKMPKVTLFFLITNDVEINLPTKRSYQFRLKLS